MKTLIDLDELQEMAINLITEEKYKEYTKAMAAQNRQEFESGFVQGIVWTALLSNQLTNYYSHED